LDIASTEDGSIQSSRCVHREYQKFWNFIVRCGFHHECQLQLTRPGNQEAQNGIQCYTMGQNERLAKTHTLTMLQLTKLIKYKNICPFLASPTGWLQFVHQPWLFHQICPRPLWFLHHEMLPAWNENSPGAWSVVMGAAATARALCLLVVSVR